MTTTKADEVLAKKINEAVLGAVCMPCHKCNYSDEDLPPRMPDGFEELDTE